MQGLFDLIIPMVVSVGIFQVAAALTAAAVPNRLLRGLLLLGGFAAWVAWMVDYTSRAIPG